ncbi:hypothetical protein [Microcoleus sp. bin38.metabat.b11b12b14.051]|uniref:hypothetical protein n=1 Tax=Microcoleus sp. bin38.metabat.b11b12b14.051 TaxID=2742709 RepID=UPI0025FAE09A|nr:hypothetical protein [Microcoleus sp. bin38.metabat.b11b12b14.051]
MLFLSKIFNCQLTWHNNAQLALTQQIIASLRVEYGWLEVLGGEKLAAEYFSYSNRHIGEDINNFMNRANTRTA